MATKRITDQTTDSALAAGDYIIIDSESEGSRKFDLGTEISELKEELENLNVGLSDDIKSALLDCFANVAWSSASGQDYYDALYNALYPPANLTSISCVYTQGGTVYDTDSLDDLKSDLVVTAHFDDSTTQTVSAYTLTGTLTAGTSTITVTYGGKTTTFDVTVTHVAQTFTVTNTLTNITTSNDATTIAEGASYSATLTAESGYSIGSVTITMDDTDVTSEVYSSGTITIASATGDIVITAVGAEAEYGQVQTTSSKYVVDCGSASANIYKITLDVLIESQTFSNNVIFFVQLPKWLGFNKSGVWKWNNADATADKTVSEIMGTRSTVTLTPNTGAKGIRLGWDGNYSCNMTYYGIKCYDSSDNLLADLVPTSVAGVWKDKTRGTNYTASTLENVTVVEVA